MIGDAVKKLDGPVAGLTWAQLISKFAPVSTLRPQDAFSSSDVAGISGSVQGRRAESQQTQFSHGEGGSGFDSMTNGPTYGAYQDYVQGVGDGTHNVFTMAPDGVGVMSKNVTDNTDTWWDANLGPILFSAVGAAAGASILQGLGGAAGAAGEAGAGAATTGAFDLGGTVGGVAGAGGVSDGLASAYGLGTLGEGFANVAPAAYGDAIGGVGSGFGGGGEAAADSAYGGGGAGDLVNDVGGLASLDSAAVGAEGATPGLTTGYGAAPWYSQPGATSLLNSATSNNPFSAIKDFYSNGLGASASSYGSLLQAGGSILNGILGSKAASNATDAQVSAANNSNALAAAIYANNNALQKPFVDGGTAAFNQQSNLNGLNGTAAQTTAMGQFKTDPGYQFRMDQGNKAVQNSASAAGGLYSGRAAKDLQNYSQGLASQEYGNYYNRLNGQANLGQAAASQQAANGNNYVNNVTSNNGAIGNAQAAGGVAGTNAITQAISGLAGQFSGNNTNALLAKLLGSNNGYY